MKKKNMILTAIVVIVITGVTVSYPVLFQEGNPIPILKGIIALDKSNDIIQISEEPKTYITQANRGILPIMNLMEKKGWNFKEQLGSAYTFSKDDNKLTIISKQYTGKYTIWYCEIEN